MEIVVESSKNTIQISYLVVTRPLVPVSDKNYSHIAQGHMIGVGLFSIHAGLYTEKNLHLNVIRHLLNVEDYTSFVEEICVL